MLPDDYYTYSYSQPKLTGVKINWGWWTQWHKTAPVNDGWYTLTDSWTVTNNGSTYDYNYYRKIIHGFNLTE